MLNYCCVADEGTVPANWHHIRFHEGLSPSRNPDVFLIRVGNSQERRLARQWVINNRLRVDFFVSDETASRAELGNWMEIGATSVVDSDRPFSTVEQLTNIKSGPQLLGLSPEMEAARARLQLVAVRRCGVLLQGETGTGKEVAARLVHGLSDRQGGPFVTVNCAAIPETLLEAELFGHVKGAFTGAVQGRIGKFEAANKGTIFLDEIGEMPMAVQSKLLRVLQQKEVERLGGNGSIPLDVRVLSATNARLEEMVQRGTFRQDLYYRLNVVRLELPPLRNRKVDIQVLATRFLQRACALEKMPAKCFDPSAMGVLRERSWPGNVRELENAIESAVALSGDRRVLTRDDFDQPMPIQVQSAVSSTGEFPSRGFEYNKALEEFERDLLTRALTKVRGNKTAAAQLLGLKRTTLAAKLRILEGRVPQLVA